MRRAGVALDEADRAKWIFLPFIAVGPLRFGMTHDEVVAALGETRPLKRFRETRLSGHVMTGWAQFSEVAVTVYYGESETLSCVAVDALHGPQVTMDGIRLVGRVPSEVAQQFVDYAVSRDATVEFGQHGDPGADDFGLVLRAQRAGDVLLTRPVFVAREWADRVSHVSEGAVPQREWAQR